MNYNEKIKSVVSNGLCIGCGACAAVCKNNSIKMVNNDFGFYEANVIEDTMINKACIDVCPFNPEPSDTLKTEDEIALKFLSNAPKYHRKIGRYFNTYAGYSVAHRKTSSSGGVATYTLSKLLEKGIVRHVISVKPSNDIDSKYEYAVSSTIDEVLESSKTKYYPVTMDKVLKDIDALDGDVAIVGVACFIKAIRLMQCNDENLNRKIKFVVGIICGGIKSSFFSEYLAEKAGVSFKKYSDPEFRIKDFSSSASDYSFGCKNEIGGLNTIKMKDIGDMWGTGLFKANACDYCDDVTTELADISLGDAWIEPFVNEGSGTNIIVTRSKIAEDLILDENESNNLKIEPISEQRLIDSQRGSFNHRHDGLSFRINQRRKAGLITPIKRVDGSKLPLLIKIIQILRMKARRESLVYWKTHRNVEGFENDIHRTLILLKIFTKINHYQRAIIRKLKKVSAK